MKKVNHLVIEMKLMDENGKQIKSWCAGLEFKNKDGSFCSTYRINERFKMFLRAFERTFRKRTRHLI
jgi:hypothetical protein